MLKRTDLKGVKDVVRFLLMTEIHKTEFSPVVVQHPFTANGIVGISIDGKVRLLDITENEDDLNIWRNYKLKCIDTAENAFGIYMMMNTAYALTFLKYAKRYLSQKDFSSILVLAWIKSESPNCDVNLKQSELVGMFRQADSQILMTQSERKRLKSLPETVTVYRGVTSYNAKNIRVLSWTLDKAKAEWFAHRYGEDGTVYEARIDKSRIVAYFAGRGESEVIIEPRHLKNISVQKSE